MPGSEYFTDDLGRTGRNRQDLPADTGADDCQSAALCLKRRLAGGRKTEAPAAYADSYRRVSIKEQT